MNIEEWIQNTHRDGDSQSLIGVDPKALAALIEAAETGLEFAQEKLSWERTIYDGYPHKWKHTGKLVQEIRTALGKEAGDE